MMRILLLLFIVVIQGNAVAVWEHATGVTLSVSSSGKYLVSVRQPGWTFSGDIGRPLEEMAVDSGTDPIGPYDEITFRFVQGVARNVTIHAYKYKPIVLFTSEAMEASENGVWFPTFNAFPRGLHRLIHSGWNYFFDGSSTDGPLVEFDSQGNTFIISPASNFMVAKTSIASDQSIATGISTEIRSLPARFSHQTLLVVEKGINRAFDTWGHALTDSKGKARPANDADITLSHLGYWTDNGAFYYYHFEPALGYEGTLSAISDEFLKKQVPLGYMQLDSWFYPKGPRKTWRDGGRGIYEYVASPELFPAGLTAFQEHLGIPLVTHGRWIDLSSPYRSEYTISGDVIIDPHYWSTIMRDLRTAGVATYEQDWLSAFAKTNFNLTDPDAFLDNMADAASRNRMTLQYCMPEAHHYLQSSKYSNLTTIRTAPDRFGRNRWDRFLYGSRLAAALGIWPWCDVFISSEIDNLLIATLSAGPVGVGDRIGAVDAANLLRAVRRDGVIVKPDVPLVPVDQTIINDAKGLQTPMIASTYTDFGSLKTVYVLAYPRAADVTVSLQPQSVGFDEPVFVYDYFAGKGQVMQPNQNLMARMNRGYAYYVMTQIGRSGIGLLGDAGLFVSMGRQRFARVADEGVLEAEILFASGESPIIIYGYSPSPPVVTAKKGSAGVPVYDAGTQIFRATVSEDSSGTAVIDIQ